MNPNFDPERIFYSTASTNRARDIFLLISELLGILREGHVFGLLDTTAGNENMVNVCRPLRWAVSLSEVCFEVR